MSSTGEIKPVEISSRQWWTYQDHDVLAGSNKILLILVGAVHPTNLPTDTFCYVNDVLATGLSGQGLSGTPVISTSGWRFFPSVGQVKIQVKWLWVYIPNVSITAVSFSGVDQASPINATNGTAGIDDATSSCPITTTVNNCWIISQIVSKKDATPPAGYTIISKQIISSCFYTVAVIGPVAIDTYNNVWSFSESTDWVEKGFALTPDGTISMDDKTRSSFLHCPNTGTDSVDFTVLDNSVARFTSA